MKSDQILLDALEEIFKRSKSFPDNDLFVGIVYSIANKALSDYASTTKDGLDEEKFKEKVAQILRDNITFSGQIGDYVIHGALEKIWQLHNSSAPESGGEEKEIQNLLVGLKAICSNTHLFIDDMMHEQREVIWSTIRFLEDFVPNKTKHDVTPVASHSSTSSNSIEQAKAKIETEIEYLQSLKLTEYGEGGLSAMMTCLEWLNQGETFERSVATDVAQGGDAGNKKEFNKEDWNDIANGRDGIKT